MDTSDELAAWRSRYPDRPDTTSEAATWLLSQTDHQADRGFVDALFDTTIDHTAFGDSRLVAPRAAFGPLASLRAIVMRLVNEHPWTVGDATVFAITGRTPPTAPEASRATATRAASRVTAARRPSSVQRLLVAFLESDPPGTTWTSWAEEFSRRHPGHPKGRTNMRRDCTRAWARLRHDQQPMPHPGRE